MTDTTRRLIPYAGADQTSSPRRRTPVPNDQPTTLEGVLIREILEVNNKLSQLAAKREALRAQLDDLRSSRA